MKKIEPLEIEVLGAYPINFKEGVKTGDMENYGLGFDGCYWHEKDGSTTRLGGCIRRSDAVKLRDFLNKCIENWESE